MKYVVGLKKTRVTCWNHIPPIQSNAPMSLESGSTRIGCVALELFSRLPRRRSSVPPAAAATIYSLNYSSASILQAGWSPLQLGFTRQPRPLPRSREPWRPRPAPLVGDEPPSLPLSSPSSLFSAEEGSDADSARGTAEPF
jgi:hypothetical protein